MTWVAPCPAKLNLFLSVGHPDERGWHPLRTRFQCIDLFDTLFVSPALADSFNSNVDYLPLENTVTKAVRLLRREHAIPPLAIHLDKQIPAQSGLGGGSSDAAGILRIARQFWGVPEHELDRLAMEIGADVSFFLTGGTATAEGYGEKLTPLADANEQFYVVVKPEVDCPTPAMFKALDKISYPVTEWAELTETAQLYNDFERVMPQICKDRIDHLLAFGAAQAGLTGSGSAVFGLFETFTAALTAAELVLHSGEEKVWTCRSLGREESLRAHER